MSTLQGSWSLSNDKKTLSYTVGDKTVATIAGLDISKITIGDDGTIAGVEIVDQTDEAAGTIKLSKDVFAGKDVKLTLSNSGNYVLALADDTDGDDKVGFEEGDAYWSHAAKDGKVTATYKYDVDPGYTLVTTGTDANKKITYTGTTTPKTIATVAGLNGNVVVDENDKSIIGIKDSEGKVTSGISVNQLGSKAAGVIKLFGSVLGTAKVTLTPKNGFSYTLGIDNTTVPTKATEENIFSVSKGTATYKKVETAYYTLSDTTLTYTAQTAGTTLATIKNLNTKATATDLSADDTKHVITVGENALTTSSVTITKPKNATTDTYTLATAEGIDASVTSNVKFTPVKNKTEITVTGNVTKGYEASADGSKIVYTAAKTGKTLATLKGVKKGLTADQASAGISVDTNDDGTVKKDDNGNIVLTLKGDVLTNANVSVSTTGYTLKLDRKSVYDDDDDEVKNGIDVWRVSGSTASYRKVTPAYYSEKEDGTLEYHAEAIRENYFTITGLKSGLVINDDATAVGTKKSDGTFDEEVITLDTKTKKVTVAEGALKTESVTFSENTAGYLFVLGDDIKAPELDTTSLKWTVSSTGTKTATLKGDYSAGYTLSNDKTTIIYAKAQTAKDKNQATLAKITGLNSSVTATKMNKSEEVVDVDGTTITLKADALGKSTVEATSNYGYKLALDDDVRQKATKENRWSVSGTTETIAEYKEYTLDYHVLNSKNNTIAYHEEVKSGDLLKLSGLKAGLKVASDYSSVGTGTGDAYEALIEVGDGNTIELPVAALDENGKTVKLETAKDYKLTINEDDIEKPKDILTLEYEGTTARLYKGKTAGYTLGTTGKVLEYSDFKKGDVISTIEGLASGLTVGEDADGNPVLGTVDEDGNFEAGFTVSPLDATKKTITLKENVLGDSIVTVKTGSYTLALDSNVPTEKTVSTKQGWKIDGTTAYLTDYTTEYWKLSTAKTSISYTPEKLGTTHATITGLAKDLKTDENWQLTGILDYDFDSNGNATITLSKNALANNSISLTSNDKKAHVLELADDETITKSKTTYPWTYKNKAATCSEKTAQGYALTTDGQAVIYTPKTTTTAMATISGLSGATGLSAPANGVITIPDILLNSKNVTFTKNNGDYKLAFTEESAKKKEPKTTVGTWSKSDKNGAATLGGTIAESYSLSEDEKSILYVKKNDNATLATLNGLKANQAEDKINAGITIDEDNNKIILKDRNILAGKAVSLTSKKYTLDLISASAFAIEDIAAELRFDKSKGSATIVTGKSKGWTLKDNKTLAYTGENVTPVATITGLKKSALELGKDIVFDSSKGTITLNQAALGTGKVTLTTTSNYKLELGSDVDLSEPLKDPRWTVNKTTATLKNYNDKGYTLAGDGKSVTYSSKNVATDTIATLKGVKSGLKPDSDGKIDGINVYSDTHKIAVYNKALGTSNITLDSGEYILDASDLKEPGYGDAIWSGSSGKATLTQTVTAGWTLSGDSKTLTYTPSKINGTLVTVSGLSKSFNINTDGSSALSYDSASKTVTVRKAALGTDKVTVSKGNSLALDTDVPTSSEIGKTEWIVSGTKATYKKHDTAYYAIDSKGAIVYKPAKNETTYVTLAGLKSGADLTGCLDNNNVITLSSDQLTTTKVTLTDNAKAGYKLALDPYTDTVVQKDQYWDKDKVNSNGVATLKGTLTRGYKLASDAKSITYSSQKTKQDLATVSGLKSGADLSGCFNAAEETITLTGDQLTGGKKVTLTNKNGSTYKLALGDDVEASKVDSVGEWTTSTNKTTKVVTGTIKGSITEGYVLTSDKTIAGTAANSDKVLAKVSGLASAEATLPEVTTESKAVELDGTQLSKKVTVGAGVLEYKFDGYYNSASINGSDSADSISVDGTGLSIKGGKGNDHIDLGTAGGNLVIYAKGDGNDVIADFSKNDKLKITGATITQSSFTTSGDDVLINVGNNHITLEDAAGTTVTVLDSNNKATTYPTAASADLIYDESNFITSSAQLDELTDSPFNAYSLEEIDTMPQNLTTLTKQNNIVTYSGDKK